MGVTAIIISICLALFLTGSSCSREEETSVPAQKNRVVKPIKITPMEKSLPEKTDISTTDQVVKPLEVKPRVEQKEVEEIKLVAAEERVLERPAATEKKALKKPAPVEKKALKRPETDTREKEPPALNKAGYYVVQKGDSLSRIAARKDVYGDPLNWPILYRLNRDKFDKREAGVDFPDKNLSGGIKLKIITPEEAVANLKKRLRSSWVVNVMSATDKEEINSASIRLIKSGYQVYITRARVRGKDWIRLRVGFFKNKAEADRVGKKIMGILDRVDSWSSKIAEKELKVFGGY